MHKNDHDDGQANAMPETVRSIRKVTFAGMAVNIAIALLKGFGGIAFSSQALFADAIHSTSDLVTDMAVILGVRYWAAPADAEHPYGHGKIEAMVTLFIAIALVIVAYELSLHAVKSLLAHSTATPGTCAFFFAVLSIISKEILYRWTHRVARQVGSNALEANAWHHRSDAISSIPVAIAVAIAHFAPSMAWIDQVGAMLVSLFILAVAWEIAKPALQELIDASIDDKAIKAKAVAEKVPGVLDVHRVRARRYSGAFAADLHIHVSPRLTIGDGHAIGHDVENALKKANLDITDIVVHVEPASEQC